MARNEDFDKLTLNGDAVATETDLATKADLDGGGTATLSDYGSIDTGGVNRTGDVGGGIDSIALGGDMGFYLRDGFEDGNISGRIGQATGPYCSPRSPSDTLYQGTHRPEWAVDSSYGQPSVGDGELITPENTQVSVPSSQEYGIWQYQFELNAVLDGDDVTIVPIAEDQFAWSNNIEIQLRDNTARIRTRQDGSTSYLSTDGTFPNELDRDYTLDFVREPISEAEDRYLLYIDGEKQIDVTGSVEIPANYMRLRTPSSSVRWRQIELGDPDIGSSAEVAEVSGLEVRTTDAPTDDIGRIYLLTE